MSRSPKYRPEWSWWIRTGERLLLGMGTARILESAAVGLKPAAREGIRRMRDQVEEGQGLTSSMRHSGLQLPVEAWCLLEAGEKTGRMGESMIQVGELLQAASTRKRELVGQLWYPAVVFLVGFLVLGIILFWVVPQMREICESMGEGARLPWITEHIGKLYGFLFSGLLGAAGILSLGALILRQSGKKSIGWARLLERVRMRMPLVGRLYFMRRESRILRQLGTLIRGGVTLSDALSMIKETSPDMWEKHQLMEFRKRLLMGDDFSKCLSAFSLVSSSSEALLATGNEAGQLDTFARKVADALDRQCGWTFQHLIRFLEPLTIFGLALAIGGLVLAYILPMIHMLERLA